MNTGKKDLELSSHTNIELLLTLFCSGEKNTHFLQYLMWSVGTWLTNGIFTGFQDRLYHCLRIQTGKSLSCVEPHMTELLSSILVTVPGRE